MSAPSSSSMERRSRAEARAGEGKDPGLRRGKSEPRSSADDSVGEGKPEGGVASAFSRVGVARVMTRATDADRLDAAEEGEPATARSEGVDLLMTMEEHSGVADVEVDGEDELDDAIIAERLLLRAAAIVSLWRRMRETSLRLRACA